MYNFRYYYYYSISSITFDLKKSSATNKTDANLNVFSSFLWRQETSTVASKTSVRFFGQ